MRLAPLLLGFLVLHSLAFAGHATYKEALKLRKQLEATKQEEQELRRSAREKIILPVSRPFHQGQTALCWAYATFNVIETNYLVQTAGSGKKLELSRSAMQYYNWEDRYLRKILTGENYLYEGGTTVDGIKILRDRGMVALNDFTSAPKNTPTRNPFVIMGSTTDAQVENLYSQLKKAYGVPPLETHFDGASVSTKEMTTAILGNQNWVAYAPSLNGQLGFHDHFDKDARKETLSYYLPKNKFISSIKVALQRGTALAISICGHDIMLYGAEYSADGKPLLYYVKDNYSNPFYTIKASNMVLGQNFCGYSTLELPVEN